MFSLFIFFKSTPDLLKKREYVIFKVFIAAFCFYLVFNNIWTLQEFDYIDLPRPLFTLVCFFSLLSVVFNGYCFYAFTMSYFEFKSGKMFLIDLIGAIPFLSAFIMLMVSLFNGIIFSVNDSNNIINGPLYNYLHISAFVYFLAIVVFAIYRAVKGKTVVLRKHAITTVLSIIFLVFWVIIDEYFDRITIIPVAIFAVILVIFISLQQSSIYTDALTQMNNRRRAIDYFYNQKDSMNAFDPVFLFLCDINSFKEINDTYGHAEGDEALIILSTAIKDVLNKYHGFSARYGGDEFMMIWRKSQSEETTPSDIVDEIRDIIDKKCLDLEKPYHLSISAGIIACSDSKKTVDSYIREVDSALYEDKRNYHSNL